MLKNKAQKESTLYREKHREQRTENSKKSEISEINK